MIPTEWIKIYPTKKALVIYGDEARTETTQLFMNRGNFYFEPYLTLYQDGQLIFGTGVYEKQLSPKETDEILTKLEQLGFFHIQDTYPIDEQNPIYMFPNGKAPNLSPDPIALYITVNGQESKTIGYMQSWEKNLTQPMKNIVAYLKSFKTNGAKRYYPDRLLVGYIFVDRKQMSGNEKIIPWPDDITPPSKSSQYDDVLYLEGTEALNLYTLVEENRDALFSYEGINFQPILRPILPNECHTYHYYPDPRQPSFTCDDW